MAWGIIGELPSEHAVPLIREGLLDLRDGKGNRATGLDLLIAAREARRAVHQISSERL